MEAASTAAIEILFESLDPALFLPGIAGAAQGAPTHSFGPIKTFSDNTGLTLSAISDRRFMAWIAASLMPLAGRRVLEVGSGTGYLAYALAQLTGCEGSVDGCEIIEELAEASMRNPLILSTPSITMHSGDFVDVVPRLGLFDVVVATSAMSSIHPTLLSAFDASSGLISLPIEIQGGGDCYTIFRRNGAMLQSMGAMLSVSVPTTGRYSSDPAWLIPVDRVLPEFDLSRAVVLVRDSQLGHPVYGTLALRSYLQAHEPLFIAVNLMGDSESFVQQSAFGLIDQESGSCCLQRADQLILNGPQGLMLAERFIAHVLAWETDGRPSLANYKYQLPIPHQAAVSFASAILARACNWKRS
jgi:protein-L-isoaspartate O-methyltransferase